MAFSRTAALRSTVLRGTRPATFSRTQLWRQAARRGYSSAHGAAKSGGDAVWAAGAVAVTVPSCWYLISNAPDTSAHHGGHDDHGKEHHGEEEEKEEDEPKEEEAEEKSEEEEKSDSEGSDSGEDKPADTPETSDDEGDEKNTKKSASDAKGDKKRVESKKSIKQGEADDSEDTDDKAAASKEAGGKDSQSGKQEGLSNADTKHSTDPQNDPEKSKKGEGSPETAKSKGTVKVDRPQSKSEGK